MRRIVIVAIALALLGQPLFAQQVDPSRLRVNINATFSNDYGQPVEGVTVKLIAEDGAREYATDVDSMGALRFEDVKPGTYFVQLQLSDFVFLRGDEKGEPFRVTVGQDGSLTPSVIDAIRRPQVTPGMWKQVLIFLGIAAAGGAALI